MNLSKKNSFFAALIIKKEKSKLGYALTLFTPLDGFLTVYTNISKHISHQIIQPFNLVEISLQSKKQYAYSKVQEISLLFSFTPPYMEFFHFFSLQNLMLQIKKLFYINRVEENQTFFIMLSSLLTLSSQIKTVAQSQNLLLSLFIKWNLILKLHEEILYCFQCGKKLMNKSGIITSIFSDELPHLICLECYKKNHPKNIISNLRSWTIEIWEIIYLPLEKILKKQNLSLECNMFFDKFLSYYFNLPLEELFSKKNNPFLNL